MNRNLEHYHYTNLFSPSSLKGLTFILGLLALSGQYGVIFSLCSYTDAYNVCADVFSVHCLISGPSLQLGVNTVFVCTIKMLVTTRRFRVFIFLPTVCSVDIC